MDIKAVTDFILEIRDHDTVVYQTIFAVLLGAVLAGILVAAIANPRREKKFSFRKILSDLLFYRFLLSSAALAFFLLFFFAAHSRQVERKDYGIEWISKNISSAQGKKPEQLIKKYTEDYFTLKETGPRFTWRFKVCPSLALFSLLLAMFLRLIDVKVDEPQSSGCIESDCGLKIKAAQCNDLAGKALK